MNRKLKLLTAAIIALIIIGFSSTYAGWTPDGIPVAPVLNPLPGEPRITSDGLGGAVVTWQDSRSGNSDIYAQRIDADGNIHDGWTVDGVLICSDAANQYAPRIISDGSGGAIITWHDYRNGNGDIYAQRINADGSIHDGWQADGEPVCTDLSSQGYPRLTSDGSGGSIITWEDFRNGNRDIYAQRIDGNGSIHTGWAVNGEQICVYAESQEELQIISDGLGGAIIAWLDRRSEIGDIYAQRIDGNGSIHTGWSVNGAPICTDASAQMYPQMTSDASGGAVIIWTDYRNGNYDFYAQRIDADGSIHSGWTADGEPVCTHADDQVISTIASDGSGGAIIAWNDYRSGYSYIFAQRIDSGGSIASGWTVDGEPVFTVSNCDDPRIISDGSGGAIITCRDARNGNWDIYAQRIDSEGSIHTGWAAGGEPVCNVLGEQNSPLITSDGSGGAVITWADLRDGNNNIYAQRIDADGNIHTGWSAYGEPVCTYTEGQLDQRIVSDGSGGAIIIWRDYRNANSDIYAQRVDVDGNIHTGWSVSGEPVCAYTEGQDEPQIASDGSGGAIITWRDYRNENYDIYAQRIDYDGNIHAGWQAAGEPVCTNVSAQDDPRIISDGAGGAIITWRDNRSGNYDIYAQRIDSDGSIHTGWTTNGEPVCTNASDQNDPRIISDGSGGAIITWEDYRNGNGNYDIYAQRIDPDGNIYTGWTINGEPVCTYMNNQIDPRLISDGSGGAFITWQDGRTGVSDIYAQRIDGDGGIHTGWTADGEPVCTFANSQMYPRLAPDGSGGAIIIWHDYRNGNYDIYAQRIDPDGGIHTGWTADGEPICTNEASQSSSLITSDGFGGAIIIWQEFRNGNADIYSLRIDENGSIHNGWTLDGEPICMNTENQSDPRIISDFSGGALITWKDERSGSNEVYAQRVPDIGLGPVCEVVPTVIDFACTVQAGSYTDTTFTISNVGVGELLGNVSGLCNHFSVVSGSGQYSLLNGQSHTVTVRFAPTAAGSHQCTIETGTYLCSDVTVTGSAYACPPDSVLYVDADASGACDGTSWADAFTDLKEGFARADLCGSVTQIWVAEGTYYPTQGAERDSTFRLRDGLAVYGGFAGTESELSERDLSANTTILSGNIGAAGDINDNSYHVVTASYTDSTAVLDGFTITAGHASVVTGTGGGMYNEEGSPTLRNLIFRQNKAREYGGGMYNCYGSNPRLYNCVFFDNTAEYYGGGISNVASRPSIVNCSFCRNRANDGGAALYNNTSSNPTITNTIMWADSTAFMGLPEILNQNSSLPVISYSCIQYCGGSGTGWEGKYGIDGGNNTDKDADYMDMATGDLHLLEGSFASDAGDSTVYGLPDTDIEGSPRIQDSNVDMGAYEGENNIITVSIDTHPGQLEVTVDGDTFTTLYSFATRSGMIHEIGAPTPQVSGDTIFSFTGWSDAGDTVHSITVPQYDDLTLTATYSWAYTCASIDSIVDVPADQGSWVRVYFRRSHYDNTSEQYPIERYDLHRRVDDPALAAAVISEGKICENGRVEYMGRIFIVEAEVTVESEEKAVQSESSENYTAAPPGVWEVVGTVSAAQQTQYIALAPTNADSAAAIPWAVYYVSAHATNPALFYDSPADSGYSVDNIAPGVPLGMSVAYNTGSGNQIAWDPSPEQDFQYYRVYRGQSEEFEPAPGNLVHQTAASAWTDPDYDGCSVYYKVTALDHAGNESEPASPETVTGDDRLPVPKEFALYQNVPNPFNPSTVIRFDLPSASHVKLRLYNARGELVAELADGVMEAGRREVVWKGLDRSGSRVASGIYFYRLTAGRFVQTRKMVLLR